VAHGYAGDDGIRRGRPKVAVKPRPPEWFQAYDDLTRGLDAGGWYRELAGLARRRFLEANYSPEERSRAVRDPYEMDRLMCRAEPVALVETALDLKVARFNSRLVVEIDPGCLPKVLYEKIGELLASARNQKPSLHHVQPEAWASHRILALFDLELHGEDLQNRKQLALWLFPAVKDEKARGDRYDRACELLQRAKDAWPILRAQSILGTSSRADAPDVPAAPQASPLALRTVDTIPAPPLPQEPLSEAHRRFLRSRLGSHCEALSEEALRQYLGEHCR
jgi:hypothetical protein